MTVIDTAANKRVSSVWAVAASGGSEPRQLSADGVSSSSPHWSPDGTRLAFLSSRAGVNQIFVLPLDGAGVFQWSPDGTRFVALSRTGPSDSVKTRSSDVRHYKTISYKFNDTGWYDDKRSHLWIFDLAGSEKQLTSGEDWNDTDPQWSPDGKRIAFVSNRTGREYEQDFNQDVWTISANGGPLTKISDHDFEDTAPRWSPDGKRIVFLGKTRRRQFPKLYIAPSQGGVASKAVSPELDLIPTELHWGPEADEVRFSTGTHGQNQIFRLDLASGKASPVTSGEASFHGFDINGKAGVMSWLSNTFEKPDDVWVSSLDGKDARQLTHVNAKLWGDRELARVQRVNYKSSDGWPVEGFLVKPVGWQAGKKYPLIVSIHGGPAGQYGVDWYHEFQVYAARGWGVFFCNPRGSTGYGEKFERGIQNNWGAMDYEDIMAGLDTALKQNTWIDEQKLGVTGGSYGGFMTNWIVGHTNRFKAAVTLRGISNFVSDDGTRDGAYGHEEDFSGFLFDDFEQYWNASPLKYAKNVKTPILILHSDNDFRVPIEQGEQWFRALKHYGVNAEIVFFPRENHNLTRTGEPKHLVESLKWQCYWFERFLDGNASAKAPDAL
jgi:dipeptidyl aminopeptidase/acylaminoacyl peptidase